LKRAWENLLLSTDEGKSVEAVTPLIISASRATDIPAFYPAWFMDRLRKGYVRRVNPYNGKSEFISFSACRVIVFWSKNPKLLIPYLSEIDARGINYYFQFTLNDYEIERLEPNVPSLAERIETFQALSERIEKKRVIWRFDPLILTDSISVDILMERVEGVAEFIHPYTERLVISFADIQAYKKVRSNLDRGQVKYREFTTELMMEAAGRLQTLNRRWGLKIASCAEGIDLALYGIEHNRCVDDRLMIEAFPEDKKLMEFLGYEPGLFEVPRPALKDKGQRKACGCIVSKDIGMYNTCSHLCLYCYANTSPDTVEQNRRRHRIDSDAIVP
jgi:DNA repair photolyase